METGCLRSHFCLTTTSHGQPWRVVTLLSAQVSFLHHRRTRGRTHQVLKCLSLLWDNSKPPSWLFTEKNRRFFTGCLGKPTHCWELQKYLILTSKWSWHHREQAKELLTAHLSSWQSNFLVTSETLLKTSAQLTPTTSNHRGFQRDPWDDRF